MAPRDQRSQRKQWRERQNNCRRASNQMTTPPPSPDGDIRQRARGRKRVALNRAKCYRKVRKLESDVDDEKRKTDSYRKRYERLLKRHAKATHPSPRTKTRNLLKGWTRPRKCNNKMKRTLTFHFALLADMKQRFSESKAERDRTPGVLSFCIRQDNKEIPAAKIRYSTTVAISATVVCG